MRSRYGRWTRHPVLVAMAFALVLASGCVSIRDRNAPLPTLVTFPPVAAPEPIAEPAGSVEVPGTIDASGVEDVSAALQAFIDAVPDGTRIVFPAEARYRLSSGLRLDDRHDLVFEGRGAELLSEGCGPDGSVFSIGRLLPSSRIAIRDLTLRGSNEDAGTGAAYDAACQFAMGVSIHASSDIEIADVTISDVHGDCVYVGGDGTWSAGIHVHDSVCRRTGRQGLAITAGRDVHVERVSFDEIGIIAFDIEPSEAEGGAEGIAFIANTVGTTGLSDEFDPMFFAANGTLEAEVSDVVVANNLVTVEPLTTLVGDEFVHGGDWQGGRHRRDIVFVGNRSLVEAEGPVLVFRHVDGLTVAGNVQALASGELVALEDTVDVDIR